MTRAASAVLLLAALYPFIALGAAPASRAEPDVLSGFRDLAAGLRKSGPGLDTGVALEYQLNRRTNACTGHEPEIRLRLRGNGRLELVRTRSFAESDHSGPGAFQGRAGKAEWDSLFKYASRMEWEYSPLGLPMPGMSESNHVIILTHAGKSARFDFGGSVPPGQQSVAQGLGAVTGMLRQASADTLWSLGLGAAAGKYRNGLLQVRATWSLRGRLPLRIRMPVPGLSPDAQDAREAPGCGTLAMRWSQRPKDIEGFTAVPSEKHWAHPQARGKAKSEAKAKGKGKGEGEGERPGAESGTWKDLRPGDSVSLAMDFPLPKPKDVARVSREGQLMHPGLPVAFQHAAEEAARGSAGGSAADSPDTSAVVTLFSEYFEF